jgi:hypothetical protein
VFEPLEPISVKGKSKPQVIYAVHPGDAVQAQPAQAPAAAAG